MYMIIKIRDFTITPGGRYKKHGKYSGEEYRESILIPAYNKAKDNNEGLCVDLDGTYGYPSSFLEEAFGGLARAYPSDDLLNHLDFISYEDPEEINRIKKYIQSLR